MHSLRDLQLPRVIRALLTSATRIHRAPSADGCGIGASPRVQQNACHDGGDQNDPVEAPEGR
jgi:hypothetical protein